MEDRSPKLNASLYLLVVELFDNRIYMTKTQKTKLVLLFAKAKKENKYITVESFLNACEDLEKTFKAYNKHLQSANRHKKNTPCIYLSMKVSSSGMTRHFNFERNINLACNVIYNNKASFLPVKVGGCGMDMLWYLLYQVISVITKDKGDNQDYNSTASSITRLL